MRATIYGAPMTLHSPWRCLSGTDIAVPAEWLSLDRREIARRMVLCIVFLGCPQEAGIYRADLDDGGKPVEVFLSLCASLDAQPQLDIEAMAREL